VRFLHVILASVPKLQSPHPDESIYAPPLIVVLPALLYMCNVVVLRRWWSASLLGRFPTSLCIPRYPRVLEILRISMGLAILDARADCIF
jgi:hypothetical protein